MNRYALEYGDEDAGDGEAYDEMVTPEEDAAELDDGEDAVLEEDTAASYASDMPFLEYEGFLGTVMGINAAAHTWSI